MGFKSYTSANTMPNKKKKKKCMILNLKDKNFNVIFGAKLLNICNDLNKIHEAP